MLEKALSVRSEALGFSIERRQKGRYFYTQIVIVDLSVKWDHRFFFLLQHFPYFSNVI